MGVELELAVLLAIHIFGTSVFDVFEVETPAWRKMLKWTLLSVATVGLYTWVGHWALLLPLTLGVLGGTVHFVYLRRHGIDPWRATPRRRYYDLRGWQWVE